jgi:hypothetical protein
MPDWINWTIRVTVWATVALTIASVIPYVTRGYRLLRNPEPPA